MWIDLHDGPLVVEVPPKVLGVIDDFWLNWVVDVGLTGPDRGVGGKYLLLPPGYEGAVPEGYFIVRPHTFGMSVAWRGFLVNGDPKPHVDLIENARVYPLDCVGNPPALKFVDVTPEAFCSVGPGDYTFWEYLNEVVQGAQRIGRSGAARIFRLYRYREGQALCAGCTHERYYGSRDGWRRHHRALTYGMRDRRAYLYPNSAWRTLFLGGYDFVQDGVLLLDSSAQCFFYGTGVTPAEEVKMVGQGSQYAIAFVDAKGQPLDGGKNYKLHLPPNIPVNNFWSIIVYDNQTRSQLQTDGVADGYEPRQRHPGQCRWVR